MWCLECLAADVILADVTFVKLPFYLMSPMGSTKIGGRCLAKPPEVWLNFTFGIDWCAALSMWFSSWYFSILILWVSHSGFVEWNSTAGRAHLLKMNALPLLDVSKFHPNWSWSYWENTISNIINEYDYRRLWNKW